MLKGGAGRSRFEHFGPDGGDLEDREITILQAIVHYYILSATPVGSRVLSRYLEDQLKLSAASIRNVMSDLEDKGYITHPHTSAGRIPTDRGYRYYVDTLRGIERLSLTEADSIRRQLDEAPTDAVLRQASRIIGALSHNLGVVSIPELSDATIGRIEIISISSARLLVIVTLESDLVRTITLEVNFEIDSRELDAVTQQLNERLSGRKLSFIRENIEAVINEVQTDNKDILRLFVDSADTLFSRHLATGDKVHIAGAGNLLELPEFENTNRIRGIIEMIESEEIVVHLLDSTSSVEGQVKVYIGEEMTETIMQDYSLLTTRYRIDSGSGAIALIGPKRMNYSKMIAILNNVAQALSVK